MAFCGENVRVQFIVFRGASLTGTDKHILSIIMMVLLHSPRSTELTPLLSHSPWQGFLHITHLYTVCAAFLFFPIDVCIIIIFSNHLSSVRSPLNSLKFFWAFMKQINLYDWEMALPLSPLQHMAAIISFCRWCNLEYLMQKVLKRRVDNGLRLNRRN